ncbi:MAG TPA: protease pro-enzyme activation domain-containing protein [Opitutaceae bacterium]|jgi:kumamolisin|nr:protease pro-enzyme activation domain-containing protein [Opitutaceae bacterium]
MVRLVQINVLAIGSLTLGLWGMPRAGAAVTGSVVLTDSFTQVASESAPVDARMARVARRDLAAEEQSQVIDFEIPLKLRNFADLETRVASGEIVSADEMSARYLPQPGDYARTAAWLQSQGIAVDDDPSGETVFGHGTVAQLEAVFGTKFARVQFRGEETTSAIVAPSVPAELADVIIGVNGLQPHIHLGRHSVLVSPESATGNSPPYYPSQIAQAYGAASLSETGSGQVIAIVGETTPAASDLTTFWSDAGISQTLSRVTTIQIASGTLPASSSNAGMEATLDVEWASALAPAAQVRVYATVDANLVHFDQAYARILSDQASNPGLHQVSISYGAPESGDSASQVETDHQYFTQLAAAGITVFASAGDGGSNPDPNSGSYSASAPLSVESPASDPDVTGCGGTALTLSRSTGAIASETAWSDGGGGASIYFGKPSWQVGTGISGSARLVPDVASAADPSTGGFVVWNGSTAIVGGTSWSAPTWAGFCALINQGRLAAGQAAVGLFNAKLYPLLLSTSFQDVTSGSNGAYAAGVGYDECTGMGSPNVATLLTALGGEAGTSGGSGGSSSSGGTSSGSGGTGSSGSTSPAVSPPVITSNPDSQTVAYGATANFSVTAAGSSPLAYQWYFNGSAIAGATASTVEVAGAGPANAGSYQVVVTNPAGSATSAAASLNISLAPAFTDAPSSQTVADGATATFNAGAAGVNLSYQWQFEGAAIAGANGPALTLPSVATTQAGTYALVVSNAYGSVTDTFSLAVQVGSRLVNISSRAGVDAADPLIAGFVIQGGGAKNVLLRAVGPGLAAYGVSSPLAAPDLTLYSASGSSLVNAGPWSGSAALSALFSQVGAFPLAVGSADAAIEERLAPASYSIGVTGNGGSGVALAEIYDADSLSASAQMVNISSRAYVGTGQNALSAGFVISGTTSQTVLIRGVGPGLAQFGIGNVLTAPQVVVFNGGGTQIASASAGWSSSLAAVFAQVGAFSFASGSNDVAVVLNLAPGSYTVQLTGANGGTGTGMVEVYNVP